MKKNTLLLILTILLLALFTSCDDTGVFDSIRNSEPVSNENTNQVIALKDNLIYYVTQIDGLKSYDITTKATTTLSTDNAFKSSKVAVLSGDYIVSYDNSSFTVYSITNKTIFTATATDTSILSKIRKGNNNLFYMSDGTYTVTVDETKKELTFTKAGSTENTNFISVYNGVYTYGTIDSNDTITVSSYYTSKDGNAYNKAVFDGVSSANDLGTFITATEDHKYLFFVKDSKTVIYSSDDQINYTKLKTLSSTYFGAPATTAAKAIATGSTIVLMKGTSYITTSTTKDDNEVKKTGSLSYDTILGIVSANSKYYIVTFNSGIHEMSVNDTTYEITIS